MLPLAILQLIAVPEARQHRREDVAGSQQVDEQRLTRAARRAPFIQHRSKVLIAGMLVLSSGGSRG